MKTIFSFVVSAMLLLSYTWGGCSSDSSEDWKEELPEEHGMKMNFQICVSAFDVELEETRSTTGWSWEDGSVVYLQFYNGNDIVSGYAVYSKSADTWEAFCSGNLGSRDMCEVYFFDGVQTTDKHNVSLTASDVVYADPDAEYSVNETVISIQANLVPLTSRVRFSGTNGLGVEVEGLKYYSGYDADNNEFTFSTSSICGQVGSNGFTSYFYCVFADENERQLSITNSEDGGDILFVKSFSTSVLRIGESGFIPIPTEGTNKGWTTIVTRKVFEVTGNGKTVSFAMKRVEAGSFQMGSTTNSNEQPVHQVTLSKDYYMGETEVTQALWYAVMGYSPTSTGTQWQTAYGLGDNYPAYDIRYKDCQQFLKKLNQLTGQQFRFPTEAEWEYAAKGRNKTNNYMYAGSNTIGEVAWYSENSNNQTHPVAQKQPNELGLYDMSGNVWEWCYDWYGSYSSFSLTDPTGPSSGYKRVYRGGGWNYSAEYCRSAYRRWDDPASWEDAVGLRLAL